MNEAEVKIEYQYTEPEYLAASRLLFQQARNVGEVDSL